MKNNRDSSFELLRIIMMIYIVFIHFGSVSGYYSYAPKLPTGHYYLYHFAWLATRCPVNVFFILTGYFLTKKDISYKKIKEKIKKIYKLMIFYSITICLTGLIFHLWKFNEINIPKMFTPFISATWYYLTAYIILIVLSPFINRFIQSLKKKEYLYLLLILIIMFSIWQSFSTLKPFDSFISTHRIFSNTDGLSLYNFILMYLIGGYISLHIKEESKVNFSYLLIHIIAIIIPFVLSILIPEYKTIPGSYSDIFVIIQAISIMLFFRTIHFKSKVINYIATFTLPVYIIHEHRMLRTWLWGNFEIKKAFFTNWYPIKVILIILGVFIACCIIDLIRRLIFKICDLISKKIINNFSKLEQG